MSPGRERIRQPRAARLVLGALALTTAPLAAGAAQPAAAAPQSSLQACASIAADADRLACYDRLAGRAVPSVPAHGAAGVAPAAVARPPVAAPPVGGAAAAAPPAVPVPPPKESFGLYEVEHPKPPPVAAATSLEARVIALGKSANGHMTVSLEGGAVWELDDSDPLLAVGETVTISRATFGSYIMHTPSKRTHRARRLS